MSVNKYDKVQKKLIPIAENSVQTSPEQLKDSIEKAMEDYSYNNINDKPKINGHELTGNQTSADLDIQAEITGVSSSDLSDMWDGTYTHEEDKYLSDVGADSVITEIKDRLDDKADKGTTLSDYGITDAYTKDKTDEKIDAAISSVYKAAGSRAFADLPTLDATLLGNVYNITDDFTTDVRFLEGSGKDYKAGTNVAVVVVVENDTNTYWFDALSGVVDLSAYSTTEEMNAELDKKVNGEGMTLSVNADGTVRLTYDDGQ